jgi:hypothetical protein
MAEALAKNKTQFKKEKNQRKKISKEGLTI